MAVDLDQPAPTVVEAEPGEQPFGVTAQQGEIEVLGGDPGAQCGHPVDAADHGCGRRAGETLDVRNNDRAWTPVVFDHLAIARPESVGKVWGEWALSQEAV
jgi:hypothetical protein